MGMSEEEAGHLEETWAMSYYHPKKVCVCVLVTKTVAFSLLGHWLIKE